MLVLELFIWWYGAGLKTRTARVTNTLKRTQDNFSIGLALKTLFKPFRQIDAGGASADTPLDSRMRRFLDRTISRFVGAFARLFLVIGGLCTLLVQTIFGAAAISLHLVAPLLPILGIFLTITGMTPPDVGL